MSLIVELFIQEPQGSTVRGKGGKEEERGEIKRRGRGREEGWNSLSAVYELYVYV